jgi:hypothetical protein
MSVSPGRDAIEMANKAIPQVSKKQRAKAEVKKMLEQRAKERNQMPYKKGVDIEDSPPKKLARPLVEAKPKKLKEPNPDDPKYARDKKGNLTPEAKIMLKKDREDWLNSIT